MADKKHFANDACGNEILVGDTYFLINNELVHVDSLEDYVIENLQAVVRIAK